MERASHGEASPGALAGTLHHVLVGDLQEPTLHESLTENWELLDRVAAANGRQNGDNADDSDDGGGLETYLLSQVR